MDTIARAAGLENANEVVSFDLICTPSQGPATFGSEAQFVAAGRQDNLSSVHPALAALEDIAGMGIPEGGDIIVLSCFDHEEVGSESRTGAAAHDCFVYVCERGRGALGAPELPGGPRPFASPGHGPRPGPQDQR